MNWLKVTDGHWLNMDKILRVETGEVVAGLPDGEILLKTGEGSVFRLIGEEATAVVNYVRAVTERDES